MYFFLDIKGEVKKKIKNMIIILPGICTNNNFFTSKGYSYSIFSFI